MKICLVGPTYPFRGGIAHHTTLLYRNLRLKHDVKFYAFKRQYPKWLFPGVSDVDHSHVTIVEEGTEHILDSFNPLSWIKVAFRIRRDNPDVVIIPWWISFWTLQFLTIASLLKKITPAKILFLCHNVQPHESRWMDGFCRKLVLRKGDCFLTHSELDLKQLKLIIPHAQAKNVCHPIYDVFRTGRYTKDEARAKFGVDGNVLLFFGFVRPYKGLKFLIEALPHVLQEMDVHLLIVGEFWEDKKMYMDSIDSLQLADRITVVDAYVPNEEIELYFTACDVVILPYSSGTGSGIAQIATGFGKPVIATDVGSLPEIVEDGRTGFIVQAERADELAKAIVRFFRENRVREFEQRIEGKKETFSWDTLTQAIEALCDDRLVSNEVSLTEKSK